MDNQAKVFKYISSYITANGYPPTVREICKTMNFASTSTAQYYLTKLQNQGLISKKNNKNRAISLPDSEQKHVFYAPIIGTVTAGVPILAVENLAGYCPIPQEFESDDEVFVLSVSGTSMINAGIFNGDKLIVKKTSTCEDNDIVVALIDDSATVKRFFKRNGKCILHPENEDYSDIVLDDVLILGKAVGLIRKF